MVLELWGRGSLATTASRGHKADRLAHRASQPSCCCVLLLLSAQVAGACHTQTVTGTRLGESMHLSRDGKGHWSQTGPGEGL